MDKLRDMYQVAVPGVWRGEMGEECSQSEKAAPESVKKNHYISRLLQRSAMMYRVHRASSYVHHEVPPSHRVPTP